MASLSWLPLKRDLGKYGHLLKCMADVGGSRHRAGCMFHNDIPDAGLQDAPGQLSGGFGAGKELNCMFETLRKPQGIEIGR